jgi:hypothetical protein
MFQSRIQYIGQIEYDLQKSRITGPWDRKDSVSEKENEKKIHACEPLRVQFYGGLLLCLL